METLFPKIHVAVLLPRTTYGADPRKYHQHLEQFQLEMRIYRPVLSETISSLFQVEHRWDISPAKERHPIRAVSKTVLGKDGALIGESPPRVDFFSRNNALKCVIDIRQRGRHAVLEESLLELARFVPIPRKAGSPDWPSVEVLANLGASLDVSLATVSLEYAELEPCLISSRIATSRQLAAIVQRQPRLVINSHPLRRARRRGDPDIDLHAELVRSGTVRLFDVIICEREVDTDEMEMLEHQQVVVEEPVARE